MSAFSAMGKRARARAAKAGPPKEGDAAAAPAHDVENEQLTILLRHGESAAQARTGSRKDPALTDCGLSRKGQAQARGVDASAFPPAELVVASPLALALLTASAVKFGDAQRERPIVVHPALREIGSEIPENRPQPVAEQLRRQPALRDAAIDYSLLPPDWPSDADVFGNSGAARLADVLAWLRARPEKVIWVVCHHNVIQQLAKTNPANARLDRVLNCAPVPCALRDGASGAELALLPAPRPQSPRERKAAERKAAAECPEAETPPLE